MATFKLVRTEIRMLFNQFKSAITTPSMLLFYGITFFGVYFVSQVISGLVNFAPLLGGIGSLFEETISIWMIYATTAVISASAVVSGYFGIGPATVLSNTDESLLMSWPVKPHQIFLSRYVRRIIRKVSFIFLGLLAVLPLLQSTGLLFFTVVTVLVLIIIFLEINYFLGAMSSYARLWISKRLNHPLRHVLAIILGGLILLPASPSLLSNFPAILVIPSNAFALSLTAYAGLYSQGVNAVIGVIFILIDFTICLLLTANLTGYQYYEVFSSIKGKEETEGKFSRFIRGEVDFSNSRLNDPMAWIIMKDFWSRLRSPIQIWKYVYAIVGTGFILYLNIFRPIWFPSFFIPPELAFAIVPAFLLMMILFTQMGSVTAMLSFADERDNVYLLKVSPFRPRDIVLAKYILSLFEISLTIIPACGFLIYLLHIQGYLAIITLTAPLVLLFSATGTAIGSYVPVMTNDPKTLPVPLAFSFPIINLSLGSLMIFIVAMFSDSLFVLILLPLYTLSLVILFLGMSVYAINTYM